jgi:hypothetical protein
MKTLQNQLVETFPKSLNNKEWQTFTSELKSAVSKPIYVKPANKETIADFTKVELKFKFDRTADLMDFLNKEKDLALQLQDFEAAAAINKESKVTEENQTITFEYQFSFQIEEKQDFILISFYTNSYQVNYKMINSFIKK